MNTLQRYYGLGPYELVAPFTGARFDTWDSTGTRGQDRNRFTADDLVAVTRLSVNVNPRAVIMLLDSDADMFAELLDAVGDDRDLAEEVDPWPDDWPGWKLWRALISLPEVGATTASKLLARKRPRLRPIYDTVIARVIDSQQVWEPLRALFRAQPELHGRLLDLRQRAGLPEAISPLRVFDVIAWMEGKYGLEWQFTAESK